MDAAPVVLLIFLLLAVGTVAISVFIQQYLANEPRDPRDTDQFDELRTREPDEMRLPDDASGQLSHGDGRSLTRGAEYRQARAEELEAVARRERQHAERAEAAARRLREWDDVAGHAPSERRARRRRAADLPEDFAY